MWDPVLRRPLERRWQCAVRFADRISLSLTALRSTSEC